MRKLLLQGDGWLLRRCPFRKFGNDTKRSVLQIASLGSWQIRRTRSVPQKRIRAAGLADKTNAQRSTKRTLGHQVIRTIRVMNSR